MFEEEIHTLAEITFRGLHGAGARAAIERQLISTFVDGLQSDGIRMKIMRDNPTTFERAVTIAMDEQNLRKRFNVRSGCAEEMSIPRNHAPMEVDHARQRIRCHLCNRVGHRARDCRQGRQINLVTEQPEEEQPRQFICWHCEKPGHTRRFCNLLRRQTDQQQFRPN